MTTRRREDAASNIPMATSIQPSNPPSKAVTGKVVAPIPRYIMEKDDLPAPPRLRALVMRQLDNEDFLSLRTEIGILRAQLSVLTTDQDGLEAGVLVQHINSLTANIGRLVKTYQDMEMERGQLVSLQRFLAVLPLLLAAIEKVVKDEGAIREIGNEWARILESVIPDM